MAKVLRKSILPVIEVESEVAFWLGKDGQTVRCEYEPFLPNLDLLVIWGQRNGRAADRVDAEICGTTLAEIRRELEAE